MGLYIPGMEMPTSCYKCPLRQRSGMNIVCPVAHETFSVADVNILDYRLGNCPLIPVPPHGRLIDANKLTYLMGMDEHFSPLEAMYLMGLIVDAPTIIPESKEGDG